MNKARTVLVYARGADMSGYHKQGKTARSTGNIREIGEPAFGAVQRDLSPAGESARYRRSVSDFHFGLEPSNLFDRLGGSIGNAGKYLKKLSAAKEMRYRGCYPVVMPENYIALFTTPTQEQALETLEKAEKEIDKAAALIINGKVFPKSSLTWRDKLSSGPVNGLFYPMFVHAKNFYSTDACVSCGKCAAVCPLENIRIENGRPNWGDDCTHCMACICRCPTAAVEYGEHSKGLPRYTCPK